MYNRGRVGWACSLTVWQGTEQKVQKMVGRDKKDGGEEMAGGHQEQDFIDVHFSSAPAVSLVTTSNDASAH